MYVHLASCISIMCHVNKCGLPWPTVLHNHQSLRLDLYSCPDYVVLPSHSGIYLFVFHLLCSHQVCQLSVSFKVYLSLKTWPENLDIVFLINLFFTILEEFLICSSLHPWCGGAFWHWNIFIKNSLSLLPLGDAWPQVREVWDTGHDLDKPTRIWLIKNWNLLMGDSDSFPWNGLLYMMVVINPCDCDPLPLFWMIKHNFARAVAYSAYSCDFKLLWDL